MNEVRQPDAATGTTTSTSGRRAGEHSETGRGHGLSAIFWLIEKGPAVAASIPAIAGLLGAGVAKKHKLAAGVASALAVPTFGVALPLVKLIKDSRSHDDGTADWTPYLEWRDSADAAKWHGKRIPMEVMYEAYMAEKLEFKQDVFDTLLRRNQLFRMMFTEGDIRFYLDTFLRQNFDHSVEMDEGEIAHVYNRVFLEATVLGKLDRNLDGVFEETRDDMKGRMDYIGVNYYTQIRAQKKPIPGASALFPYLDSSPDLAAGVWLDDPAGLGEMVTWAAKSYGLPVIITENGTSRDKTTAWDDYVRPHLIALHDAMADPEVRVLGYFYWSLLDNYEWNHGMAMRFGLYGVDTDDATKPRTLTPLGAAYGEAARRNGFD